MDPATLAAIVAALASLFGGGSGQDTSTGAEVPAGAGAGGVTPGFTPPTPGADLNIGAILQDTSSQAGLQAPVVAASAPTTVPLSPGPAVPPAPAPTPSPAAIPDKPPASIGEILAASPEALLAVAQLLGIGGQDQSTVRAAPIPGGTTGSILPGLQLPQSSQLGALLQQIPGLR